jgi:hypothetical protein
MLILDFFLMLFFTYIMFLFQELWFHHVRTELNWSEKASLVTTFHFGSFCSIFKIYTYCLKS